MEIQRINKNICNVVSTGSRGNCVIYHNSIAISMGIPFNHIQPYIKQLQLVITEHRHSDHMNIRTIAKLSFERPSLRFGCGIWLFDELSKVVKEKNIDVYEFGKWYNYGPFKIAVGKLFHDVPNMFVRIKKDDHRIIHATDTNTMAGISAQGYDLFCIESNYNEQEHLNRIAEKEARGEYAYERQSMKTHLSEQQAQEFYRKNRGPNSELIRLHETYLTDI